MAVDVKTRELGSVESSGICATIRLTRAERVLIFLQYSVPLDTVQVYSVATAKQQFLGVLHPGDFPDRVV